jgi:hypothetical protein
MRGLQYATLHIPGNKTLEKFSNRLRTSEKSVSLYRAYSVNTDNTLIWIFEMYAI